MVRNASDQSRITCKLKLKDIFTPPVIPRKVIAIHKPNISALAPNEKILLIKTINQQLKALTKEMEETKNLTIKTADDLSIKTAKLTVGTALQFRCRRSDEKSEKSQYVKRTSERLQTIRKHATLFNNSKPGDRQNRRD